MPFDWIELVIAMLPIIMLIIALKVRRPLAKIPRWHIVPVDVTHPTLWVSIHALSVRTFYFSLFPVVLILIGALGLWQVIRAYRQGAAQIPGPILLRRISNPLFVMEFIDFYVLVSYRLWMILGG